MASTLRRLLDKLSLAGQIEDYDIIHDSIRQGIIFRGTNLWILVCAIIIASVGLNTNSTAVIIGAMLISPLMGPINGMGYSIAIYDFTLFRQSIKNFGFAVLASLIASTIYFAITPMSTAHSELLARTSPTIYDVLIALFGGGAGMIAISSRQKGNVIPGVAIATALMPPLCTAGYGLATGQLVFFYGAFYLFTINTVCIAYSAVVVSQMLNFPIRAAIDDIRKKRINQGISVILAIIILPSIYLGYKMSQDEKFRSRAQKYTQSVNIYKGNYLLNNEVIPNKKQIILVYGGSSLSDSDKVNIIEKAKDFSLDNVNIDVRQGLSIENNTNIIQNKYQAEETTLKQEISRLNDQIKNQQLKADSILNRAKMGKQLLNEVKSLYPQVEECTYSDTYIFSNDTVKSGNKIGIITFSSKKHFNQSEKERLESWLKKRLNEDNIKVYFNNSY